MPQPIARIDLQPFVTPPTLSTTRSNTQHMLFLPWIHSFSPPPPRNSTRAVFLSIPFKTQLTGRILKPSHKTQKSSLMACAATRATFSFNLSQGPQLPSPKSRTHFSKLSFLSIHKPQKTHFLSLHSIDVSKEDKPPTLSDSSLTNPPAEPPVEEEETPTLDQRRLEEKFAVLNTGIYECRSCGYKYDESVGDPSYPIPPGFQFDKLPGDWRCPTCGAAQSFFVSKSVEIAGFAQNQQYGLGGNTLTSGQKTFLIFGALFFFFVLFLSGYFLQ